MSLRVLHVIPSLSGGGGARAAVAAAAAASQADSGLHHTVASLRPADPVVLARAAGQGIEAMNARLPQEVAAAIERSDLVHLHFWNSPELVELLESELPSHRLLLWCHVEGRLAPQVLPGELVDGAGVAVGTSERPAQRMRDVLAERGRDPRAVEVIEPIAGWDRIRDVRRSDREGFNVGYIGTVGRTKLHPRFAEASAAIDVPDVRIIVCGTGEAVRRVPRRMAELGAADRIEMLGVVEDIGSVFADLDVFGYPLREDVNASSDLVLKETLYCGVPPVVLPDGGSELLVEDGVTGVVARDIDEYPAAVEALASDPAERARLARNGRERARESWSPERIGPIWIDAYERLMAMPARGAGPVLPSLAGADHPGARRFLRGAGVAPDAVVEPGDEREALEADRLIAESTELVGYLDGGLLDYRRRHPDDHLLALWCGLFLADKGRTALAAAELSRARALGCPAWRLETELARAAAT